MNATPAVPPPPAVGAAAGAGAAATSAAAAIARPANLQALWALLQSPGGAPINEGEAFKVGDQFTRIVAGLYSDSAGG